MRDHDEPLREGAVLKDRYELRRRVGEGGMGTVFEAFDRLLERRVAVKFLRAEHGTNAHIVARFELEAKIASAFQHPNVATTFDVGAHESGARYLVMEYLEGLSLADAIERSGPLPDAAAVALVEPIARALAKAHQAGVIHRDVKPDNIFLVTGEIAGECTPKLVDFGIARREQDASLRLTATATIIGTPAYMPPEQARGSSEITGAVDQYALGVVLYELLSGAHPHAAPSTPALLARKLTEPPMDLRSIAPTVAPALADAVMRTLESDPRERFADMTAMRDALVRAVPSLAPAKIPPANRTVVLHARVDSDAKTEEATPEPRDNAATPATRVTEPEPHDGTVVEPARSPQAKDAPAKARAPRWPAPVALVVSAAFVVMLSSKIAGRTESSIASIASSAARVAAVDAGVALSTLEVRVEPRTAKVVIDGVEVGRGEARVRLAPGSSIEVALHAEGFVPRVEQRRVTSDERIERVLEPAPVATAPRAIDPPDASLSHRSAGTATPRARRTLQLGRTGFVLDTEIQQR